MTTPPLPLPPATRSGIRQGIARYFGGTLNEGAAAYQGGPLSQYGLGSVRYSYGKEVNMNDFFVNQPAGHGFGAVSIVTINSDRESRESIGGPPLLDSSGNIVGGGWKMVTYSVTMDSYFISQEHYAEHAEANCDVLIEAMKERLRQDRTLGGICLDAGETSFGLRVSQQHPTQDQNRRTLITFNIQFEVRVMIVA